MLVALSSCEGDTNRTRIIENKSSNLVTVKASIEGNSDLNETIKSGEETTLFNTNQLGGSDVVENPSLGINSLVITNESKDTLRKNFTLESNWEIKVEQTKKVPSVYEHEYRFVLYDEDFK